MLGPLLSPRQGAHGRIAQSATNGPACRHVPHQELELDGAVMRRTRIVPL